MITEKAKKNANACRFCFMCRHLCPVGINTGNESHTPRAKGLMMSLVERGEPYTKDIAEVMYECCLCDACSNHCATGYEPFVFIREARTMAVVNDVVPEKVKPLIESLTTNNNIFSKPGEARFDLLKEYIKDLPKQAETVLYIGGTAAYKQPETAIALIELFNKAGVDFTVLKNENQSGAEMGDLIGFVDEVKQIAHKTSNDINEINAKNLVVLDPHDARMFKQEYKEWGYLPDVEIYTATSFLMMMIKNKKLMPKKTSNITVTYQDPCHLARSLNEIAPSREIMGAMGLIVKEMFRHGEDTKCCGTQILNEHSPKLANLAANNRYEDAVRTEADYFITSCPGCYDMFDGLLSKEIKVIDLFCLLNERC